MIPDHIDQISADVFDKKDSLAVATFVDWVRKKLAPRIPTDARIVSIDGWDGVGKSAIGDSLAECLAVPLVDLDEYLDRDQGEFLAHLRLPELETTISTGLDEARRVIVTGCMMDLALEGIGRPADFRVYVMRLSGTLSNPNLLWVDRVDELYSDKTADELIAEDDGVTRKWAELEGKPIPEGQSAVPDLQQELIRYHKSWRPHDRAHLIVKVIERRS
ncbi:MAG: hypothetical protein RJP95_04805 [Pirellulales bacterium]